MILDAVEPRIEPLLPMALLVAGAAGRDLEVHAPVDAAYLVTLRLGYLPLLRTLFGFQLTGVEAAGPDQVGFAMRSPDSSRAAGPAALLFSGGVDSSYSFIRLREAGHPLQLLVNVNAGAHGPDRDLMRRRYGRVRSFARDVGLDALLIDTNFHELLAMPHLQAWQFRNLSAAMALVGAAQGCVVSSTYSYRDQGFERAHEEIDYLGVAVSATFAWSRMPVTEVGADSTRIDKVRVIAEDPCSYRLLEVCVNGPYQLAASATDPVNCGRCSKCIRTMLTLDHLGRLGAYATQFDIHTFGSRRSDILAQVLRSDDPNDREVIEAIRGETRPVGPLMRVPAPGRI